MAQRMSTSRAVRPAALMALLVMMLFDLLWVVGDGGLLGVGVGVISSGKVSSKSVYCLLVKREVTEQEVGAERQSDQQYRSLTREEFISYIHMLLMVQILITSLRHLSCTRLHHCWSRSFRQDSYISKTIHQQHHLFVLRSCSHPLS